MPYYQKSLRSTFSCSDLIPPGTRYRVAGVFFHPERSHRVVGVSKIQPSLMYDRNTVPKIRILMSYLESDFRRSRTRVIGGQRTAVWKISRLFLRLGVAHCWAAVAVFCVQLLLCSMFLKVAPSQSHCRYVAMSINSWNRRSCDLYTAVARVSGALFSLCNICSMCK